MSEYEGFLLCKKHRAVILVLLLFGGIIMCVSSVPEVLGISTIDAAFVFVWTFLFTRMMLPLHQYCMGYGVSRDINRIVGKEILNESQMVLGGYATKHVVVMWFKNFGYALFCVIVGITLGKIVPNDAQFGVMIDALYTVAIGICASTLCAIYIWLMADRKRLWYFSEEGLKQILEMHKFPLDEKERIVIEARAQGLLLRQRMRT